MPILVTISKNIIMQMNKKIKTTMSIAAAMGSLVLAAGSANAATIAVGNHSFELDGTGRGGSISKAPWMKSGGTSNNISIELMSTLGTNADAAPDATDTVHYTNGTADNIYQVLVATLAANTTYTLRVDVGDRSDLNAQAGSINLGYVSAAPTGDNDYGLNLLSATVVNDTVPFNDPALNPGNTTDGWETWESTFTTGAAPTGLGQALRIELVTAAGVQTLWDNVRLTAVAVPEPSTTALLGLGGLALILRRRK
ncbi:MAG: hypothetical protein ACI9FG_000569 [Crocinitomicaceae bacterium]